MHIAKRSFDIVVGSALALAALPLIVITALLSALTLRAWPLFVQRRVGRCGRLFRIIKIRTLPTHVPNYVEKTALEECSSRPMAFLRRTHLDELPQLFLVPPGKMSLVGPRPEMQFLHERLSPATAKLRTSVRPGCTGLWQISDGSVALITETLEYDRYYLAQQTFRFDLWIIWRTFRLMFTRARPVGVADVPQWVLPGSEREAPIHLDVDLDIEATRVLPTTLSEPA